MMLGELRVAMSLARHWRDQGKVSEAGLSPDVRVEKIVPHTTGLMTAKTVTIACNM